MKHRFIRHCKPVCVAVALLAASGTLQSQKYSPQLSAPAPPEAPVETPAQRQQRLDDAQKRADDKALVKKAQTEAAEFKRLADELATELKAARAATAKAKQAEEAAKAAAAQETKAKIDAQNKAERERIATANAAAAAATKATADALAAKNAQAAQPPAPVIAQPLAPKARIEAYAAGPILVVLPKVVSAGAGTKLGQVGGAAEADEKPTYEARLPYNLAMGEAEVTFGQWNQCVKENACNPGKGNNGWVGEDRPVMNISWNDIQGLDENGKVEGGKGYLNWLNKKAGIPANSPNAYRLPTEAEWELAARAGSNGQWSLGADNNAILSDKTANYAATQQYANSLLGVKRGQTVEVKSLKAANAWGLHDMHGNVWEWAADCYVEKDYERRERANVWNANQPVPETLNCARVLSGGSWGDGPRYLRSASRSFSMPGSRSKTIGFRLARTLP